MPKLIEHGIIEKDVFGSTPDLDLDHLPLRPREILQWIRDNTSICPWQKNRELPQICQFVVLDDRNLVKELYGESLHGQFVQTNTQIGLTKEIAKKVIKLLNRPAHLTCTSTWALNHWSIFHEFDYVTYIPTTIGIRVVDNRSSPEKVNTPLNYLPSHILSQVVGFLSISDLASVSIVSHEFDAIASSNKLWQPLHQSLKENVETIQMDSLLLVRNTCQTWPLASPIEGYYKIMCNLFLASTKYASLGKLDYARKFLQCSRPDTELCIQCNGKSHFITMTVALNKYGLTEAELHKVGSSRPPRRLQKKKKIRRLYCEAEVQLLALLKWGNLNAIRKRRASWQTTLEEVCLDGSRKAVRLLRSLKLQNKETIAT